MTIQPYDFSRPPSLHPETRAKLVQWLTRSNSMLAEVIAQFALKVGIQVNDCSTAWPTPALLEWSDKAIAYRVRLASLPCASVIAVPNPLAQVIVAALMGHQLAEWPQERDLTPSEICVGEYFVGNMMNCLVESWLSDDRLDLKVVEIEPNLRRTKVFKVKQPFVVCKSMLSTEIGQSPWCWMLPHDFLSELFGSASKQQKASSVSTREQLEVLARGMTTQMTIRLGGVQLSAAQVAALQVGDLVVLNQKTTEPLRAIVSGKPKYLGWPGRVGNRQAFEIASEGSRRERAPELAAIATH